MSWGKLLAGHYGESSYPGTCLAEVRDLFGDSQGETAALLLSGQKATTFPGVTFCQLRIRLAPHCYDRLKGTKQDYCHFCELSHNYEVTIFLLRQLLKLQYLSIMEEMRAQNNSNSADSNKITPPFAFPRMLSSFLCLSLSSRADVWALHSNIFKIISFLLYLVNTENHVGSEQAP